MLHFWIHPNDIKRISHHIFYFVIINTQIPIMVSKTLLIPLAQLQFLNSFLYRFVDQCRYGVRALYHINIYNTKRHHFHPLGRPSPSPSSPYLQTFSDASKTRPATWKRFSKIKINTVGWDFALFHHIEYIAQTHTYDSI